MSSPLRGQVFRVDLGFGAKPWVVVSDNQCDAALDTVIAARITTTIKRRHLPTAIELGRGEPVAGVVLVDDLHQLYRDELDSPIGRLSPRSMQAVSAALRVALP